MPELPEVETIKNDLKAKILHSRIENVTVHDGRVIRGCSAAKFADLLKGKTIANIERYGKSLVFTLDRKCFLFIQLRMTGTWLVFDALPGSADPAIKITFKLSPLKYLVYNDQRVLGILMLTDDPHSLPFMRKLGEDPLSKQFTVSRFIELLRQKKAPVKTALLDQNLIAGIGNIYASEILFASNINPHRAAKSITDEEAALMFKNMRLILKQAIKYRGTSMRNYRDASGQKGNYLSKLKVYGKKGGLCPKCGSVIKRSVQAGRSTFYCEKCQH
jgi:formamidopyrimidine-DNA glycosylase